MTFSMNDKVTTLVKKRDFDGKLIRKGATGIVMDEMVRLCMV